MLAKEAGLIQVDEGEEGEEIGKCQNHQLSTDH